MSAARTDAPGSSSPPSGIDAAALAALVERRGAAALAAGELVAGSQGALDVALEAFGRLRAALAAADGPPDADPEALLRACARAAAAARLAADATSRQVRCPNTPGVLTAHAERRARTTDGLRVGRHLGRCASCQEAETRLRAAERAYAETPELPLPQPVAWRLGHALLAPAEADERGAGDADAGALGRGAEAEAGRDVAGAVELPGDPGQAGEGVEARQPREPESGGAQHRASAAQPAVEPDPPLQPESAQEREPSSEPATASQATSERDAAREHEPTTASQATNDEQPATAPQTTNHEHPPREPESPREPEPATAPQATNDEHPPREPESPREPGPGPEVLLAASSSEREPAPDATLAAHPVGREPHADAASAVDRGAGAGAPGEARSVSSALLESDPRLAAPHSERRIRRRPRSEPAEGEQALGPDARPRSVVTVLVPGALVTVALLVALAVAGAFAAGPTERDAVSVSAPLPAPRPPLPGITTPLPASAAPSRGTTAASGAPSRPSAGTGTSGASSSSSSSSTSRSTSPPRR